MKTITLYPLLHRNAENIALGFEKNSQLNDAVKKIKGVKWSNTHRCWYLPMCKESYDQIVSAFNGKASIHKIALQEWLHKKKKVSDSIVPVKKEPVKHRVTKSSAFNVSTQNLEGLNRFVEHLTLHAYSKTTIHTYRNEFIQLLQRLQDRPVNSLTASDLREYMHYLLSREKISENTAHSRLNALKYYFEQVLGKEKFFCEIPRPKKTQQLPKVFSQEDIASIINSVQNLKHKTMLMLAYSAGLRVSEVVTIKTYQVDSNRMNIFISQAKGKKDRMVTLSPVMLVMLREYAKKYKPNIKSYLFEGAEKGSAYSTRSLQQILSTAKKQAGVNKPGSIHSLRHSFATHLIEKGTDVTMIQKLLGHNDIKTTLIYLHTSNKDLLKIISPLDSLDLK
ncbi:MAG: site-specific integrase [Niastella sp.]|nr:site-specific integrase [Niastella sp.]